MFLATLLACCSVNLICATRSRPGWASIRSLLSGERFELTQNELAMTEEEARSIVDDDRLVMAAAGWPVALGLATLASTTTWEGGASFGHALHQLLIEEMLADVDADMKLPLCLLAFCDDTTVSMARSLLGADVTVKAIAEGQRCGLLTINGEALEMHPLIQETLRRQVPLLDSREAHRAFVARLIENELWDSAFVAIATNDAFDLLTDLVVASIGQLLSHGREATVEHWLDVARRRGMTSPVHLYAEGELACRRGEHRRAEALALEATRTLPAKHSLMTHAWGLAGRTAHLTDRYGEAIERHTAAEACAVTECDRNNAVWGQFVSAAHLERDLCIDAARRVFACDDPTPEGALRLATAHYEEAIRGGSLAAIQGVMERASELSAHARDPWQLSSFLNIYCRWLSLRASYDAALASQRRQLAIIESNRLIFAMASTLANAAQASLGRRDFAGATRAIAAAKQWACDLDDPHNMLDIRATELRLFLARQAFDKALTLIEKRSEIDLRVGLPMKADYQATRALVLACAGTPAEARRAIREICEGTAEAETLVASAKAITLLRSGARGAAQAIDALLEALKRRGSADSFVAAYRAHPALLERLVSRHPCEAELQRIIESANDRILGRLAGMSFATDSSPVDNLSKRETQVYGLLAQGLTNREIARLLFVQEVTVKVHVRHIFEKLGVRNRVEAVSRHR